MPWVSIPFYYNFHDSRNDIVRIIPCNGYPHPAVICVKTGKVIDADCYRGVNNSNFVKWMEAVGEKVDDQIMEAGMSLDAFTPAEMGEESESTEEDNNFDIYDKYAEEAE